MHFQFSELKGSGRVDAIQGEKGAGDLISLLSVELHLCCSLKLHKCKRGVNCFHISFR